jgi:two-component system sensor histidine kinase UhpB
MLPSGLPLFWRLFLGNAAVLLSAGLLLAVSPATVSFPISVGEAAVIAGGLSVMLVLNVLLLRQAILPLERLSGFMRRVGGLTHSERIPAYGGSREVVELTEALNQMLRRLESERRQSARRVLSGQEDERARIAYELHDEVGQSITAVILHLERVASGPADRYALAQAMGLARESLEEVRGIVRRLRPEALDDLGLIPALTTLTDRVADASGIQVRHGFDPHLPNLNADAELVVYRVAQEALTNVVRHAGASRVEVRLEHRDGGVRLRVVDDGRGFGNEIRFGSGIGGMRERALLIGANLKVTPGRGGGVEVQLDVPVVRN